MNISSINAKGNVDSYSSSQNESTSTEIFQKGEVVEGVITKVSDKISINFSGEEVTVSKSTVQDAREGEVRQFKIMDVSNHSIVLKEVGSSTNNTSGVKTTWTNVETFKSAFAEYQAKLEEEKADESAKEKLQDAADRLTSKDYDELMKEGKYLEAFSLVRLDQAISRIKEQRASKEENLEIQIEKKQEYKKEVEQASYNNGSQMSKEDIAKQLESANLPATEANIARVTKAMEIGQSAGSMSQKSMGYLIDKGLTPTIENIYKAEYSSYKSKENPLSEEQWDMLKPQVEEILKESSLEVNEENLQDAKWLLDQELPLTKESLEKLHNLREIKEQSGNQYVLNKIINGMVNSIDPMEVSLDDTNVQIAKQAMEDIHQISDAAIHKVVVENKEINLENLKDAQQQISADDEAKKNPIVISDEIIDSDNANDVDIKAVTAKRQLEEIRLMMTVEAGQKLADKGFNINTESLEKVVEQLKEIENNYYRSLLQESNVLDSDTNISLLKETTEKVKDLQSMPSYLLGSTLSSRSSTTINTLHEEGNVLNHKLSRANETYDALMTSPRKDLGDSITKAFRNVDQIIEDMELPVTEANRRAVKILGYNSMEITEENIIEVKEYDASVNQLFDNLKPAVTVNLIKEGINPLDMPIEELNTLTEQIREEIGVSEEEKYSEYLWRLEKQDGITDDERKSYIGVYRLLNNVEKTDGAAIGAVLNANQDVTLNNLLTAVRTMKSKGIDKKVDDNFGALESISFSSQTITQQLESSFDSNQSKTDTNERYQSKVVKNIYENITPDKLEEVSKENDIVNLTLEELKEELAKADNKEEITREYYSEKVGNIRELAANSEEAIDFLMEYQLPCTLETVSTAKEFLQGNGSLFKKIINKANDLSESDANELLTEIEGLIDGLDDKESMLSQYEKIDESVTNILNKEYANNTLTSKDISQLKIISNSIDFIQKLSNKEYYEIPLSVNGSITNINLTIVNEDSDIGKVAMKVESEQLGMVEANFTVKNGEVKGLILCNSKEGLDLLKNTNEAFVDAVSNNGLQVKQIDYGTSENRKATYILGNEISKRNDKANGLDKSAKATSKQLYQVAKTLVLNIKNLETGNE